MKKILIAVLLGFSTLYAQDNTFLKGKISNPNGKMCHLYMFKVGEIKGTMTKIILDSSEVKSDGTFTMAFNIKEQVEANFDDGNEQTSVLLNSGDDLTLTLNTKMFDETVTFSGKGSEKNNAIKNLYLIKESIGNKIFAFDKKTDTTKFYEYMKSAWADYGNIVEDYRKEIPELKVYAETELERINQNITQAIISIKEELAFTNKVAALIGTNAIDFEGVDLKGSKLKLSSFKGKTIVVDFWATWCGPCKAEMPDFKKLEEKYGTDINFVSVGLYCKKEDWAKMATEFGFKNNIFLGKEEEKQIKGYDVNFIPRYIVIDKNLKVIDANAPRPSSGDMQKYFN